MQLGRLGEILLAVGQECLPGSRSGQPLTLLLAFDGGLFSLLGCNETRVARLDQRRPAISGAFSFVPLSEFVGRPSWTKSG